jgi:hypothetical protein
MLDALWNLIGMGFEHSLIVQIFPIWGGHGEGSMPVLGGDLKGILHYGKTDSNMQIQSIGSGVF